LEEDLEDCVTILSSQNFDPSIIEPIDIMQQTLFAASSLLNKKAQELS
jgi:hypothetical protein